MHKRFINVHLHEYTELVDADGSDGSIGLVYSEQHVNFMNLILEVRWCECI